MKSALVMSDTVRGALATSALRQAGRIVGVRRGVCTVARLVLAAHHSGWFELTRDHAAWKQRAAVRLSFVRCKIS